MTDDSARKPRHYLRWAGAGILFIVTLFLLGVIPINAGPLSDTIEEAVHEAVGLELSIGDRVVVRLGPTPMVKTGKLSLGSPGAVPLVEVDEAIARLRLLPLLAGRIHLREVRADGVRVDYCADLELETSASNGGGSPRAGLLQADLVEITRASGRCSKDDDRPVVTVDELTGTLPAAAALSARASGVLADRPFELSATGDGLDTLLARNDYGFDVALESSGTYLRAVGELVGLAAEPAVELTAEARSEDIRALAAGFGFELPLLGELDAETGLTASARFLELTDFTGSLGRSRFALDGSMDFADDRSRLVVSGTAETIDVEPFMPGSSNRDPVDADLHALVEALNKFDADVELSVGKVIGAPRAVSEIVVDAELVAGVLTADRLSFVIGVSHALATGRFDAGSECPRIELVVSVDDFDFETLSELLELPAELDASAKTLTAEIASCGYRVAEHRDSLQAVARLADGSVAVGRLPEFSVDELELSIDPDKRSRLGVAGRLAGENVQASVAAGTLDQLFGTEPWLLTVDAAAAGARIALRGTAPWLAAGPTGRLSVTASVANTGTLKPWLPGLAEDGLPLNLEASVVLDASSVAARDIDLTVGGSSLNGTASWAYARDPQNIELELRSPVIRVDELATALAASPGPTGEPSPARRKPSRLPTVDLDLAFEAISGAALEIEDLRITGRIRDDLIDDARLSLLVEQDLDLEGSLDMDFRRWPPTATASALAQRVDLGRLFERLDIAEDVDMRADRLELLARSSGQSPVDLLVNAQLETRLSNFEWNIPRGRPGEQAPESHEIRLEHLTITSAPGTATTATSSGRIGELNVGLWLEAPTLPEAIGDAPELPLRLVVSADRSALMFDVLLDRSSETEFRARTLVSGGRLASDDGSLAELDSPLPDYRLGGTVVLDDSGLRVPDLEFAVGDSELGGRVAVLRGERSVIEIEIESGYLQTEDLLNFMDVATPVIRATEQASNEHDIAEAADTDPESPGLLPLIDEAIGALQASADIDVSVRVNELHAGQAPMGSAAVGLSVREHSFELSPLSFRLPGGGVEAAYTWAEQDGRLRAKAEAHATALTYGGLLRLVDPDSEAEGLLYLDTRLESDVERDPARDVFAQILSGATGRFEFAAWPQDIGAGLLDLWTANLVLALLPIGGASDSRLNCLVTRFEVNDGLMKSKTAQLDTTTTIIRGRGTIDLANDALDLLVTPQAKRERLFSASTPVRVTGRLRDPQIGVEPIGLIGTLVKWYTAIIYVPFKWLTGERFPEDGTETCFELMDWELTPELRDYLRERDFSQPPAFLGRPVPGPPGLR